MTFTNTMQSIQHLQEESAIVAACKRNPTPGPNTKRPRQAASSHIPIPISVAQRIKQEDEEQRLLQTEADAVRREYAMYHLIMNDRKERLMNHSSEGIYSPQQHSSAPPKDSDTIFSDYQNALELSKLLGVSPSILLATPTLQHFAVPLVAAGIAHVHHVASLPEQEEGVFEMDL